MSRKILITGGAGFIGTSLTRILMDGDWDITVIDSLLEQVHPAGKWTPPAHIKFFHADIRDRKIVSRAIQGAEYIVHLAAETGVGQSAYEIARYVGVNEYGTAVLLDEAEKNLDSLKGVILASSRAVYGEGRYLCKNCGDVYPGRREPSALAAGIWEHSCPQCNSPIEPTGSMENQPLDPASCYSITKHNQEQLLSFFSFTYNIPAVALRFQNVYGPGQSLTNPYTGILSIFSTRIASGNPVLVYEDGKETRDFVYIDDVVRSIRLALEGMNTGFDVYNVGIGEGTSVLEVARTLVELMKSDVSVDVVGKYRVGDIRHAWADMKKTNQKFGFTAKVPLREGLKSFVSWANKQPEREDRYESMEKEMADKGLLGRGKI